jgi:hypothetical protein
MAPADRTTNATANPWGLSPYTARALLHLAEGGARTEDVDDLLEAARSFLDAQDAAADSSKHP